MIIKGVDDQKIEIKIQGYQFPETKIPKDWDSNWLWVYLKVQSKFGDWEIKDPALTTFDLKEIVTWFNNLAQNKDVCRKLFFTEPNLEFNLIKASESIKYIRIIFSLEFRPRSYNNEIEYYVDCELSNKDLTSIASQFEQELKFFPKR